MSRYIEEWEWDDANLLELGRHGLSRDSVIQVWRENPRFRPNRRGRAATDQMIGPDLGGQLWVICIYEPGPQRGLWRAITGWRAEPEDIVWHKKRTGEA